MTYYTMTEQLTARTDMKWNLKAVLVNITNKVQIPKDKLNGQIFILFSVSSVSQEMGMPESTTSDQFAILQRSWVAYICWNQDDQSHRKVKMFKAELDILSKIISGEIQFKPQVSNEPTTATVEAVTATVGAATATVIPPTAIVGAATATVTSIQIEQANGSSSNGNTQMVAAQIGQTEEAVENSTSSNVDWVKALQAELKSNASIADAVDYKSLPRNYSATPASSEKMENN